MKSIHRYNDQLTGVISLLSAAGYLTSAFCVFPEEQGSDNHEWAKNVIANAAGMRRKYAADMARANPGSTVFRVHANGLILGYVLHVFCGMDESYFYTIDL